MKKQRSFCHKEYSTMAWSGARGRGISSSYAPEWCALCSLPLFNLDNTLFVLVRLSFSLLFLNSQYNAVSTFFYRTAWSGPKLAKCRQKQRFCHLDFHDLTSEIVNFEMRYQAQQISVWNHYAPWRVVREVEWEAGCQQLRLPISAVDCLRLSKSDSVYLSEANRNTYTTSWRQVSVETSARREANPGSHHADSQKPPQGSPHDDC